jgi:hypothetical protein
MPIPTTVLSGGRQTSCSLSRSLAGSVTLHDDEGPALVLADVEDRADPGVVEPRGGLRLALESLEDPGALSDSSRQELERDVALETKILGVLNLPHTALAQLGGDPVVGNGGADHLGPELRSEAVVRSPFRRLRRGHSERFPGDCTSFSRLEGAGCRVPLCFGLVF